MQYLTASLLQKQWTILRLFICVCDSCASRLCITTGQATAMIIPRLMFQENKKKLMMIKDDKSACFWLYQYLVYKLHNKLSLLMALLLLLWLSWLRWWMRLIMILCLFSLLLVFANYLHIFLFLVLLSMYGTTTQGYTRLLTLIC